MPKDKSDQFCSIIESQASPTWKMVSQTKNTVSSGVNDHQPNDRHQLFVKTKYAHSQKNRQQNNTVECDVSWKVSAAQQRYANA